MAVYDPVVFDIGIFDSSDPIPTLLKASVVPQHGKVKPGQGVTIFAYIIEVDTTPDRAFPLDPSGVPEIVLYDPENGIVQVSVAMVNVAPGVYRHQHEVNVVATQGPYSAVVTAVNGTKEMVTPKMVVFTVI